MKTETILPVAAQANVKTRTYTVKEVFLSLQAEGFHSGRRAVFVRFAGCNLWSGREQDRAEAQCKFCDTDFLGGFKVTGAGWLADFVEDMWGSKSGRFVVLTGGEPTLQADDELCRALHDRGFEVAIETNGTRPLPQWLSWVCVSPKAGTAVVQKSGNELKVVWPQAIDLDELDRWAFRQFYLQPMDGVDGATEACIAEIHKRPNWKLSLQTHKLLGLR